MHAWQAIQNALDTIEENLSEDLSIAALANGVALSPYYFQRLFSRLVKKPVNEYIRLRRLAKATQELTGSDRRIVDVALNCGFSGHTSFTRAFTEAYGISPEEYRNAPILLNQFIKPDLRLDHVEVDEDVPLIADGVVVEVTRRSLEKAWPFMGIAHEIPGAELSEGQSTGIAMLGALWQDFHLRKASIPDVLPGGKELGVVYTGAARDGCCTYLTAAEAAGRGSAAGYATFALPAGSYVVCKIEAENFGELTGSALDKAYSFLRRWMQQHDIAYGSFVAELYSDSNPDASWMELWTPVRAKSDRPQKKWDKDNRSQRPALEQIDAYVDSPLWEALRDHIETEYQCDPRLEFSKCFAQYGWNIKYKKAGRSLCTLYPLTGHFIVLVVIGQREQAAFERALPSFSGYLQQLYRETPGGMGQKWLMIAVRDAQVLEDVKRCLAIRRGTGKTKIGDNGNADHLENTTV
jgi:AraC family transcriptional regulator